MQQQLDVVVYGILTEKTDSIYSFGSITLNLQIRKYFRNAACVHLQSDFVELGESEDGFLHHVHTFILQQHVQISDQSEKELIVPFTG